MSLTTGDAQNTWQDACRARGGTPTVDPASGYDACRLPDGFQDDGRQKWRYENANKSFGDLIGGWISDANNAFDRIESKVILAGEEWGNSVGQSGTDLINRVEQATGLDDGLTGLGGKVLGIPHWLFVVLLLVAGYAFAVGAGVFPPLRKVFK